MKGGTRRRHERKQQVKETKEKEVAEKGREG